MDSLYLSKSILSGSLSGRRIFCKFHTVPVDIAFPRGEYGLILSDENPIHGAVLALFPQGTSAGKPNVGLKVEPFPTTSARPVIAKYDTGGAALFVKMEPFTPPSARPVIGKSASGATRASPGAQTAGGVNPKKEFGPAAKAFEYGPGLAPNFSVLAVSAKPIGGMYGIVIDQGFSDLLDAVKSAGVIRVVAA